jgi:uncharacterized repeat protein (TIGR01451 family)
MGCHGRVVAKSRVAAFGLAAVLGSVTLSGAPASAQAVASVERSSEAASASVLDRLRAVSSALGPKLDARQAFRPTERQWNEALVPGLAPEFAPDGELMNTPSLPPSRRGASEKRPEPLGLFYPISLADPFVVEGEGVRVALRRLDAANVAMSEVDGKLVYAGAHVDTDVVYTASPDWAEELIWLGSREAPSRFDYEIVEAAGATDVRVDGGAVYFTNEARQGLVLSPPVVLDSDGHRSATAARWELSEAEPTRSRRLTLRLDASGLVYPLAIDPGWSTTGSLATARESAAAILLHTGEVLAIAGVPSTQNTVERYDPATGRWSSAAPIPVGRGYFAATLLLSGKVLVVGGWLTGGIPARSCYLYDVSTNSWSPTGDLNVGRMWHTATLLLDGRVLVTGGENPLNTLLASAEIYDPGTGAWTSIAPMSSARSEATATRLGDGRILFAGGAPLGREAEIFDPGMGSWTPTGSMAESRSQHSATLLPNGDVLAVGDSWNPKTPETYDVSSGSWSLAADLVEDRGQHTATLLPNGRVLVVGGSLFGSGVRASTETYDFVTNTWAGAGNLAVARNKHKAVLLPTGKVLVVGGWNAASLTTTEVYDPDVGTWSATGEMTNARVRHTATLLRDGRVLAVGDTSAPASHTAERYDPGTATWTPTGDLLRDRYSHTATLLLDGRVLAAGGGADPAEVFDPDTGTWALTGVVGRAPRYHTATLLPCGEVLLAGGQTADDLRDASIYNPRSGRWRATGNMTEQRSYHTATLLRDGSVLVTGGWHGGSLASAELFDPSTGLWSATGSMAAARDRHTATLLPNGKVLVVGRSSPCCELFDPAAGTWSAAAAMTTSRDDHEATLLPNGRVLVTGGWGGVSLSSSELYDPETNRWLATGAMAVTRMEHSATVLLDGRVLVAGGSGPISSAEIYDVGRGEDPAWRPVLASATDPLVEGNALAATGNGFRGISEASTGNGVYNSATDYPLVLLQRVDNRATRWLPVDPATGWSDASFTSPVLTGLQPGPARATVFTNGIPSVSRLISVECRAPAISANPANHAACAGDTVAFSVTASATCATYQWRRNGTPLSEGGRLSGTDTSSLTIALVEPADAGAYDVVVSSPCSSSTATSAAAALTVTVQTAVTDLAVTSVAYDSVGLAWSAVGASSYEVYRSDTTGGPYAWVGSTTGTTYLDETVASGRTYYYVVRAQGACLSATSNEVSAATPPVADLAVTKTADDEIVAPGAPVIYTVTVTNNGPNVATAVSLVDDLPADTAFVSVDPAGSCSYAAGTHDVTCTLGDLGVGASAVVTIQVNAPATAGEIVNTATASSVVDELPPVDRSAELTTIVYEMAVTNEVLSFTATTRTGTREARLEWRNPNVAEYVRTYVRYASAPAFVSCVPPDPTGGTLLASQSRIGDYDAFVHGGLTDDTVYCYSVFVYWGLGRLSREKTVNVRPVAAAPGQKVVWAFSVAGMTLAPPGFGGGIYVLAQGVYPMMYGASRGTAGGERLAGWDHVQLVNPVQHRPVTVPVTVPPSLTRLTLLAEQGPGGRLYGVDGMIGAVVWRSPNALPPPPPLGPLQGAPSAWLTAYGADQDLILTGTRKLGSYADPDNVLYAHDPRLHDATSPPDGSNAIWTVGAPADLIGAINGGPSLDYATKRVFFATMEHPSNLATVWCASLLDGNVLWSRPYGNITGTPSLRRGRVYVGNDQGVVYALDASNGDELWHYDTHTVVLDGGVNGTVFVDRLGDDVYFATDSRVWSLSEIEGVPVTASLNWSVNAAAPSPPLLHTGTNYLYFGSTDGHLHQVDVTTGAHVSVQLGDGAATVGTPAVDSPNNLVYVGTEPGVVHAVELPLN